MLRVFHNLNTWGFSSGIVGFCKNLFLFKKNSVLMTTHAYTNTYIFLFFFCCKKMKEKLFYESIHDTLKCNLRCIFNKTSFFFFFLSSISYRHFFTEFICLNKIYIFSWTWIWRWILDDRKWSSTTKKDLFKKDFFFFSWPRGKKEFNYFQQNWYEILDIENFLLLSS